MTTAIAVSLVTEETHTTIICKLSLRSQCGTNQFLREPVSVSLFSGARL